MGDTDQFGIRDDELEPSHVARATLIRVAKVQGEVKELKGRVSRIDTNINGNGVPGIKTQIDRLEIWQKNRIWLERVVIAAVAGLVINALTGQ